MFPHSEHLSFILLLFISYLVLINGSLSVSTSSTDNYRKCNVKWGSNKQSFNVLIDTTSSISWVFNKSSGTDQSSFDTSKSTTYQQGTNLFKYEFLNHQTVILSATDTFTIDSKSCENTEFAIGVHDFSFFDDISVSGILALNRKSEILNKLRSNDYIENKTVTFNIGSNKMYFSEYSPSSSDIVNTTNVTCITRDDPYLGDDWAFELTTFKTGNTEMVGLVGDVNAIIDVGSPYIAIYADTQGHFDVLWENLVGKSGGEYNCNYTSTECTSTGNVQVITIGSYNWSVILSKSDLVDGKNIKFILGGIGTNYTHDSAITLCIGEPVLSQLYVKLNLNDNGYDWIDFTYTDHTTSIDWLTIIIVAASVLLFTTCFFGIYFWKYGKIPAHTNHDVEEQSLLRGPIQQTGSSINNRGNPAAFSGIAQPQQQNQQNANQLQSAPRQQPRSQPQPQPRPPPQQQQQLGSGSGQSRPDNPNDLRQRRLKFLEEQQKKEQQQQNDDQ